MNATRVVAAAALLTISGALAPSPPKTLDQLRPGTPLSQSDMPESAALVITQPGYYFLTGNITGNAGNNGIEIKADDVTLDLKGYAVVGVPNSWNGITVPDIQRGNIAIINGTVRKWGMDGIGGGLMINCVLRDLRVSDNAGDGIYLGTGRIDQCLSRNNGGYGFWNFHAGCLITGSRAEFNGASGFQIGESCVLRSCSAISNAGAGFLVEKGSMVVECSASDNLVGINIAGGSVTAEFAASANANYGLFVGSACVITDCAASSNSFGIYSLEGEVITRCSTTSNNNSGIRTVSGLMVGCTSHADGNQNWPLDIARTVLTDCSVSNAGLYGLKIGGNCLVLGNTLNNNGQGLGQPSMDITGSRSRVEDNMVTDGSIGIRCNPAVANLVIGNSCSGNSPMNFNIGAGNSSGPIVTQGGIGALHNPHANFAY